MALSNSEVIQAVTFLLGQHSVFHEGQIEYERPIVLVDGGVIEVIYGVPTDIE